VYQTMNSVTSTPVTTPTSGARAPSSDVVLSEQNPRGLRNGTDRLIEMDMARWDGTARVPTLSTMNSFGVSCDVI
jgi:hypothetical protein